jgi:pyrimidine-nucleoside phosphorylase
MRMYDIISKKKYGGTLDESELAYAVNGFTKGLIPDYQMSALLMAICLRGMSGEETLALTHIMAASGDMLDLGVIDGPKADKHSTGGVGDKTTLIVAPIAAACGVKMAKMSGRGLGHTGGTIDKLEAIPGLKTNLGRDEFIDIVKRVGMCVISQSGNITPADKKLYALRDVTATVDSMPLIASSIMSKKLAAGADVIVLDVKCGSGAFMKNSAQAKALASEMVKIGRAAGRRCSALITNMDEPLGSAVGNSLEVAEAARVLHGEGPADIRDISLRLAGEILYLSGVCGRGDMLKTASEAVESGRALNKLCEAVRAQGGDDSVIRHPEKFAVSDIIYPVKAEKSGYIAAMKTDEIGECAVMLGAGRETKESTIDPSAGIMIVKKTGQKVESGEIVAELHTSDKERALTAARRYLGALDISPVMPRVRKLIEARVDPAGEEDY